VLKAAIENASVVVLGRFNPAIFQPTWFRLQGLVPEAIASSAEIRIITPEIAAFSASWFSLQVTRDRFQLETVNPDSYPLLRDLAIGTFSILNHTPVGKIGINTRRHYRYESEKEWHAVGHGLAPKDPWKGVLNDPGVRALIMWGQRPGTKAERVEVRVEPDSRDRSEFYIIIITNHEYKLPEVDGALQVNEILAAEWDDALAYGRSAAETLLTRDMP
jgi:hypothetical protein